MRCRLLKPLSTRACLLPAVASAAVMFFVVACSNTTRDRVMHFFFEYPDPEPSTKALDSGDHLTAREVAMGGPLAPFAVSRHRPFVERRCDVCHDAQRQFAPRSDQTAACARCHAGYFEAVPFGHAPVLTKDCTVCHTMHVSRHDGLLRFSQATLCTSCHEAQFEDAALTSYHRGISAVDCTACHDPHGSALRMLLKPEKVRPQLPGGVN